jgi:Ni,Fe-hydrogenase III small subunit
MLKMFTRIIQTGLVTEPEPDLDNAFERLGIEVRNVVRRQFAGSLHIRQVDAGSCNGCELEIQALNNSFYAIERFGVHFVASPRHADILLVTGPVSRHMQAALTRTYAATAAPRWVIAAGECACSGGEFGVSYASCGALENILPVDVKIPGCPPTPVQLMTGILRLAGKGKTGRTRSGTQDDAGAGTPDPAIRRDR